MLTLIISFALIKTNNRRENNIRNNYNTLDEFVLSTIKKCPPKLGECLKASAETLLNDASLDEVMSVMKLHIHEADIFNSCHQITHEFGRIEYKKSKNIKEVFNKGNYVCYEGFFHGATEAYFLDKNISMDVTDPKFKDSIPKVCGQEKDYKKIMIYMYLVCTALVKQ